MSVLNTKKITLAKYPKKKIKKKSRAKVCCGDFFLLLLFFVGHQQNKKKSGRQIKNVSKSNKHTREHNKKKM